MGLDVIFRRILEIEEHERIASCLVVKTHWEAAPRVLAFALDGDVRLFRIESLKLRGHELIGAAGDADISRLDDNHVRARRLRASHRVEKKPRAVAQEARAEQNRDHSADRDSNEHGRASL